MKIQLHVARPLKAADQEETQAQEGIICQELVGMLRTQLEQNGEVELTEKHPDLIHFFGFGDTGTMSLIKRARHLKIPCVITPLSMLQPWNTPHLLLTQTHKAFANPDLFPQSLLVVSSSLIEQEYLQEKYKNIQLELLENPVVTTSISNEDYAHGMVEFYARLIASHDADIRQQIAKKIEQTGETDEAICEILRQTEYIAYQFHRGLIGDEQLALLGTTLTQSNYDESLMGERLSELGRAEFFAQLETIMQEKALLTEGFMPIPALPNTMFKPGSYTPASTTEEQPSE